MTQQEWLGITSCSRAVSIKHLGCRVVKSMVMRNQVGHAGASTTINSTFLREPYFELFRDTLHKYDDFVAQRPATNTTIPKPTGRYPISFVQGNNFMQNNEVTNQLEGFLPRPVWAVQQSAPFNGYTPQTLLGMLPTSPETATPWMSFSTLSEGIRETVGEGGEISQSWSGHGGPYPITLPQTQNFFVGGTIEAAYPVVIPASRRGLLTGIAPQYGGTINVLDNCKHGRWFTRNLATAIPESSRHEPVDLYIKLNRMYTPEGPFDIQARLLIEYTCTVESIPIEGGFNVNSLVGSQAQGGDTSWLASTTAFGRQRDLWSWGYPDQSDAPITGRGGLYQPATITPATFGQTDHYQPLLRKQSPTRSPMVTTAASTIFDELSNDADGPVGQRDKQPHTIDA